MNKFIDTTHAMVVRHLSSREEFKDYEIVRVYDKYDLSDDSVCLCDITNIIFDLNVHAHLHNYLPKIEYYLHQLERGYDRVDEGVKWLVNESSLASMSNEEIKTILKQNIPPFLYTHNC